MLSILTVYLVAPSVVFGSHCAAGLVHNPAAANPNADTCITASDPNLNVVKITTVAGIVAVLEKIFNLAFYALVLFASFMILSAAFTYLTSEGEAEKVEKAKKNIVYAVIGLVVASFAWGLPGIIRGLTGV